MTEIARFNSIVEAAKQLNIGKNSISDNLNNRSKSSHKKFIFKYLD